MVPLCKGRVKRLPASRVSRELAQARQARNDRRRRREEEEYRTGFPPLCPPLRRAIMKQQQQPVMSACSTGAAAAAAATAVPAFLSKLWALVGDAPSNQLITWSQVGVLERGPPRGGGREGNRPFASLACPGALLWRSGSLSPVPRDKRPCKRKGA